MPKFNPDHPRFWVERSTCGCATEQVGGTIFRVDPHILWRNSMKFPWFPDVRSNHPHDPWTIPIFFGEIPRFSYAFPMIHDSYWLLSLSIWRRSQGIPRATPWPAAEAGLALPVVALAARRTSTSADLPIQPRERYRKVRMIYRNQW